MVVDFSEFGNNGVSTPILLLKNKDGTVIQSLGYANNVELELNYNELSVLTFDVPKAVDGVKTPHYDDIVGTRIVELVGIGQFILSNPESSDNTVECIKSCKAYSLEYELVEKKIYLEAGTYNFYNAVAPTDTVIARILERMTDWRLGSVDTDLLGRYRTFSDDVKKNVYDFIKSDVQEKFGCIFEFDTYTRTINVRSVSAIVPTKSVYLSGDNLIDEIKISENSDEIVTALGLYGADGVTVRSVNPTGENQIYNLDYFMNETNFTSEFIEKWRAWEAAVDSYREYYYNLTMQHNLKIMQRYVEQGGLSDARSALIAYENDRASAVQAISMGVSGGQSDLDTANDNISSVYTTIDSSNANIVSIQGEINELYEEIQRINALLKFDAEDSYGNRLYFTDDDIAVLKRYFIEDDLEDSSFVAATVSTYSNKDLNSVVSNKNLSISGSTIDSVAIDANHTLYDIKGGTVTITTDGSTFSGSIISATAEYNSGTNQFVLTAYMNKGSVGLATFDTGNLTVAGNGTMSVNAGTASITISSGRLFFTKNNTEYEQHQIEWELLQYGQEVLAEKSQPSYSFDVDCGNFLYAKEFEAFKSSLTGISLGNRLYLKIDDGYPITPYVVSVHVNFEDPSDFSIEFGNTYTSSNKAFSLADLLDQSISMGRSFNAKSGMYGQFVTSGASTTIKEFMDNAFDVAVNNVMSSGAQAISFDDSGIHVRKWADDDHTEYEDEQIWIVDNIIAFTDDNWNTAKMAIGKIVDENLVSDDNPTGEAYGIVAPYIVGTILAGENLVIDTEDGSFKVDQSGVHVDDLKFYITHTDSEGEDSESLLSEILAPIVDIGGTLSDIINSDGYLKADKLQGVIDSAIAQMSSANGNIFIGEDGVWVMDHPTKETATKAIWINENGIAIGTGTASDDPAENFTWLTAINLEGVTADALASKTLSSCTINGGSISIGTPVGGIAPFRVDTNGNMYATSGVFSGSLSSPTLNGLINLGSASNPAGTLSADGWLSGCGIKVGQTGDGETSDNYNFYVDRNGNLTLKGNINLSDGNITWGDNLPEGIDGEDGYSRATVYLYKRVFSGATVSVPQRTVTYNFSTGMITDNYPAWGEYLDGWSVTVPADDGNPCYVIQVTLSSQSSTQSIATGDWSQPVVMVKSGKDGADGTPGSDANVDFANVNNALGQLFKTWQGGTPTSISGTCIYSPNIQGGEIYGCKIYAGTGGSTGAHYGYTQMSEYGLTMYDSSGLAKIALTQSYYDDAYGNRTYFPEVLIGAGATGSNPSSQGSIIKYRNGLWIGESDAGTYVSNSYPPTGYNLNGIYIDFTSADGEVYKYSGNTRTVIGGGGSGGTAVFG